ncbi:hypothetical protein B0O99DRAFT_556692 [Bisporella sp. PMI_857]|nr:hypothetical protein B0O99DRAFT_556692 [Bisporella sp. PMI_857]
MHQDIVNIAQDLKRSIPRDTIKHRLNGELKSTPGETEMARAKRVEASIDLAVQLFLMMDLPVQPLGVSNRPSYPPWNRSDIKSFLASQYSGAVQYGDKNIKLQKIFNIRNLEHIAGIKFHWTRNLADHLRLDEDNKELSIFQYKSFLQAQKTNDIYPTGFIEEALKTLSLLFPPDPETRKWLKKTFTDNGEIFDKQLLRCNRLQLEERQIENFKFWHDRIVILKEFFDEVEPSTISQWWFDQRKRVQWYTFWVAAVVLSLTVFFGLVQSIEAGMQVWKAWHP